MNKKGTWGLWVSVILVIILILLIFFYFTLFSPRNEKLYSGDKALVNPISGLSHEEAISQFNESFITYLLYEIKAYNLHNPPLSGDTPKILVFVGDDSYGAEIDAGSIYVHKGGIEGQDIIIRTSKEESVNMLSNEDYVKESFQNGKSNIELAASKSVLFGKGYLSLYEQLTGKSVTGSVIRIYSD